MPGCAPFYHIRKAAPYSGSFISHDLSHLWADGEESADKGELGSNLETEEYAEGQG